MRRCSYVMAFNTMHSIVHEATLHTNQACMEPRPIFKRDVIQIIVHAQGIRSTCPPI